MEFCEKVGSEGTVASASYSTSAPLPSWILDKRETDKINYRRRLLEERATRIHRPRATSIAVDVNFLNKQVREKEIQMAKESRRNKEYDDMSLRFDKLSILQDYQEQQDEIAHRKELVKFWKDNQPTESRQEYDLNSNNLQDCGYHLSFVGEDEELKEREKAQKAQMEQVLAEQIIEKQLQKELEDKQTKEEVKTCLEISERGRKLSDVEELCRKAEAITLFTLNQRMAEEKKRQDKCEKDEETEAIKSHICHVINSTMLTEDAKVARSALGPNRVLCNRWKGMTEIEREKFHDNLVQQMVDNERRRLEVRKLEKRLEEQMVNADRVAQKLFYEEEERRRLKTKELERENASLAEQQRKQRFVHHEQTATNVMTDDFFGKFGVYPR